jgi:hypothetical protein|tara:strand:+ start:304 stop:621 length:318 start_codon:yes stop_codon:yes gene_type:complete
LGINVEVDSDMKDDPMLPPWVESVLKIEGVEMSSEIGTAPGVEEPCPDCGREVDPCTHPEVEGELPDRQVCYDCWTLLHGRLAEGEEMLCRTCGHFDYPLVRRLP